MRRLFSRARSGRGQGLVEFALVAPILLLILLIAIDFGRALQGYVVLQNTSRVAANFAATNSSGWDGGADDAGIRADYAALIAQEGSNADCVTLPSATVPTFVDGPDTGTGTGEVGDVVTVQLSCPFDPIAPFIDAIVGDAQGWVTLAARTDFAIRDGTIVGAATQPPLPTPTPSAGPTPTPTPTAPACITVPDLVHNGVATETVAQARAEWTGAGFTGSFSPNGQNNKIVLTQSIPAGNCVAPSTAISVTHT